MEIAPRIHTIPCIFSGTRIVMVHLLIGETRSLLIDTAMKESPEQEILPYMRSIGFNPAGLTYILISHSDIDHQEGNAAMRAAAPNALFIRHTLYRPRVE